MNDYQKLNKKSNYNLGLDGILLIDKPTGCTSHDVVNKLRRKLSIKRIGHAGTLDPLGTGLLIMLIGKATKASQYLMNLEKEYEATIKLGESTDSQDADGSILEAKPVPSIEEENLKELLKAFEGDQYQTPPMYSAKKVNGVPLYKLARKGKEIAREPRPIKILKLELKSLQLPFLKVYIHCSKGTYVRTLAHDIGQKIGCGAHLTELRRVASSHFRVCDAISLNHLENMELTEIKNRLIPLYRAVPN